MESDNTSAGRTSHLAATIGSICPGRTATRPPTRSHVAFSTLPVNNVCIQDVCKPFALCPSRFELQRIRLAAQEVTDHQSIPRRIFEHLHKEAQLVTGIASIVLAKGVHSLSNGLSVIAELPRRANEQRLRRRRSYEELHKVASATALFEQARGHEERLDLRAAIAALESALVLEPANAPVLCLLSKQWTDHTFLEGLQPADVRAVNERAIHLARQAQASDPALSLAHCAECISKGRLATFEPNPRRKLQLAKEAQEAAYAALERDTADDIAHHLIGRWNVGMAGLNVFVRACIRYVFGTEFRPGTMEDALRCYEAAKALRPDRIIHRVELARCYEHFGQRDRALTELQACLGLPLEDINARQMLKEGTDLLAKLDPSFKIVLGSDFDTKHVVPADDLCGAVPV